MTRDIVRPLGNFFSLPLKDMEGADYRRAWIQARINELRGERRLGYAEIARRAGVTKQYLHQVANGASPSERLISGMCKAFGFDPPSPEGAVPVLDEVKHPAPPVKGEPVSQRQQEQWDRIERALAEQAILLRTLAQLLVERSPKP